MRRFILTGAPGSDRCPALERPAPRRPGHQSQRPGRPAHQYRGATDLLTARGEEHRWLRAAGEGRPAGMESLGSYLTRELHSDAGRVGTGRREPGRVGRPVPDRPIWPVGLPLLACPGSARPARRIRHAARNGHSAGRTASLARCCRSRVLAGDIGGDLMLFPQRRGATDAVRGWPVTTSAAT